MSDEVSPSLPPDEPVARPFRPALLVALLLIAVLGVHSRALEGPFFWDDVSLIVENPAVQNGTSLRSWFTEPFWDPGPLREEPRGLYRPLTLISYRADRVLHGDNPAGFHATNLALHGLSALLLYLVSRRLGASALSATLAVGCWAVLPRLTECTAWIAGRTDLLALVFSLLALLLWPWSRPQTVQSPRSLALRVVGSSFALLLALLSKEVALAAVLSIAVAELARTTAPALRLSLLKLAPVAIVSAVYFALRLAALDAAQATGMDSPLGTRLLRMIAAAGTYALMLLDPFRPNAQVGLLDRSSALQLGLGIPAAIALVAAVVWAFRRRWPAPGLAVCIFGVTSLFLVLHLIPLPSTVLAADRFLYLPCAALAILAAVAASRLDARRGAIAAAACLAFVIAGGWFTWQRIGAWNEPLLFWVETAERAHEDNYLPVGSLALALQTEGYYSESEALQRAALDSVARIGASSGSSLYRIGRGNLAETLTARGEYARAAELWRSVLRETPDLQFAWLRLGRLEAWLGNWKSARECTERALHLAPADPLALRQAELLPVWEAMTAQLPDKDAAAADDKTALTRVRSLTLLRMVPEAGREWKHLLPKAREPAVLAEGLRFFAEDAPGRDSPWALGALEASQWQGEQADALRTLLVRRAESAARVEVLMPRIQSLIAAAERRRGAAASN